MTARAIVITFADPSDRFPRTGYTDAEAREKFTELAMDHGFSVMSVEVVDVLPMPVAS